MKFSEYIKYNSTSISNNTRYTKIDERKLMLEHASDLDSIIYKYSLYANNISNHIVNESAYDETFTLSEQAAANGLLRFVCEEYLDSLNNELTLYEHIYNDTINESIADKIKNAKDVIVTAIKNGKSYVKNQINSLTGKIEEIKDFLQQLADNAIKSVKEMTEKLMALLEKFDCTITGLFEKIKIFDINELEKSWTDESEKIANQIKANPNEIEKFNVYNDLENKKDIIIEEEKKEGKAKHVGGWKQALLDAFKQLLIWAAVCIAIPGIVIAAFPGTFIALLVPLVCKLAWNGYKIFKIYKQFKKVKDEWEKYSKLQKWITVISMVASLVALICNFKSLAESTGPVLKGLYKSGFDLLSKANLGIQPDALQRSLAALINMIKEHGIKNINLDNFWESYDAISESFNQHLTEKVTKTVTAVVKKGQDGVEFIKNNFENKQFKTPQEFWNKVKPSFMSPNEVTDDGMYDVVADGVLKGGTEGNAWSDKVFSIAKEMGMEKYLKPVDGFNKGLHEIFSGQGSVTGLRLPGKLVKALSDAGCLGNKNIFGIVGSVANTVSQTTVFQDVVQAATSMLVTIPSVELTIDNGKFRIRLGEKGSKNYVYEVGDGDVRKVKKKNHTKEYEDIKKTIEKNNDAYIEQLREDAKKDKSGKKLKEVEKIIRKFKNSFKKIDDGKCILIYGKRVKEDANESCISYNSLHNYILEKLNEEKSKYTFDDFKQNFKDLRDYLNKIGLNNEKDIEIVTKKGKKKTIKNYAGNTQMLLKALFSLKETSQTNKLKFNYDHDYKPSPYETIKKRIYDKDPNNDKFGPLDIEILASKFADWSGDKNYYEWYCYTFVNVILLKRLFMENKDLDTIISVYKNLITNIMHIKEIANDVKDKEWKPKEEWAPIKFNEDKVKDDDVKKVKDAENNADVAKTPEEAEQELQDADAPIPNEEEHESDDSDKKEETTSDKQEEEEDDGKVKPIMILVYGYGKDLANADKSGPRKDPYSMKGLFNACEFMTIEGGTSKENLAKLFGEILHQQVNKLYKVVACKPCNKSNELDDNLENDKERPELANLTNAEAASLLKDKKKGAELVKVGANKVSAAETPNEKKQLEQYHKTNDDAVKNYKELQDELKEINQDLVDDNGNLNEKEWKRTNNILSEYQLSKHKEKSHKGFFGKIWGAIKNFFFGDGSSDGNVKHHRYTEEELEKINKLIFNKINNNGGKLKESYNDNDVLMLIRPKSLSQYIQENRNR